MVTDDQVMQSQRHGVVPLAVRYANSYVRRLFAEKDLGGLYHLIGVVEKERSLPEEFWLFCRLYEWGPARSGIWQHYEGLPEQRFQQILGALERLGLPEIAENHRLGKAAWDGPDRAAALDAWLDSRAQEIHDLAFGCGTKQDVPLPQTTPFDSNPKARAAHLDS